MLEMPKLYRILGRLDSWRSASRYWRARLARLRPASPSWVLDRTVFDDALAMSEIAADLGEQGYHAGLRLPLPLVAELRGHAEKNPCWREHDDLERFLIRDVHDGRSPLGKPVAVADTDAESCRATAVVAGDARLVDAVRQYLGYTPTRVVARLWWSPPSGLSDDERRWSGQTIDYHYDIERRETVYVYFYLSDTDRHSGAHVVVAGSHKAKPLRMKLGSTRQPEHAVLRRYGADKVVVLEGAAGFGFLEVPSCFHKVLPPRTSSRLLLQLRYS